MSNDRQDIPVIKLKGTYLAESLAAHMLGKDIQSIRGMVKAKEIKGIICNNGQVSVLADSVYLTPKTMASMMHVSEKDVMDWINSGELNAVQSEGRYKISHDEYTKFGQSGKWMPKFHEYTFEYMKKLVVDGAIINEVNEGFIKGMKPHIEKARGVIEYLEQVHSYYDCRLEVLNEKSALIATYIIMAKVISILYSSLNMIEKGELIGASALFRTVCEGVDLAMYFTLSENTNVGKKNINKWFEGKSIKNATCLNFIAEFCQKQGFDKDGKTRELKNTLYDGYCKLVHLNYHAIMESYNAMVSNGFGHKKVHRMGFDYKSTKLMRKTVSFLSAFEGLLESSLTVFLLCFQTKMPLEESHFTQLKEYHAYYSKTVLERNEILKSQSKIK